MAFRWYIHINSDMFLHTFYDSKSQAKIFEHITCLELQCKKGPPNTLDFVPLVTLDWEDGTKQN